MTERLLDHQIAAVRRFNRFFTRHLGVLQERLLHSPYSLTESRIIYEIATRDQVIAADLSRDLGLDAGYLSRILDRLQQKDILEKVPSDVDGRRRWLCLTKSGQAAFALLDSKSREEISRVLGQLSTHDQACLLKSMRTIEQLLGEHEPKDAVQSYLLRGHEPGDMGAIIQLHGRQYAEEFGWNEEFEALVAQICADFLRGYDPDKERCWIAEMDGQVVGSVFVVQGGEDVAKLRLLIVDRKARGLGLGTRLVDECIRFARQKGYKKMVLWTNSVLVSARRIYQKAGFHLVDSEPHHSFGHDLVGETWEMYL